VAANLNVHCGQHETETKDKPTADLRDERGFSERQRRTPQQSKIVIFGLYGEQGFGPAAKGVGSLPL
jgi:hypothetical protein